MADNVLKFAPIPDAGRELLSEKDFVDVVDAEGNPLPSVPKHWGEDQLPPGAKKVSKKAAKKAADKVADDGVPKGNAPTEEWIAYARKSDGFTEADLLAADGETPLTRDELRAKFGPQA
jgi:nucleotide-binding universal stress UspA family protein